MSYRTNPSSIRRPRLKAVLQSIVWFILWIAAIFCLFLIASQEQAKPSAITKNTLEKASSLQQSLDNLKTVQQSLEKLEKVISDQSNQLKATSQQLEDLTKQKDALEKVLSLERPKVDAVLAEAANQKSVWSNFTPSYILFTVATSVIGAICLDFLKKLMGMKWSFKP